MGVGIVIAKAEDVSVAVRCEDGRDGSVTAETGPWDLADGSLAERK